MDIAVIGAGVPGLSCAWQLQRATSRETPGGQGEQPSPFRVTLYEAGDHAGGHAPTVDVEVDGVRHSVDTGFLLFSRPACPRLAALFEALGVATSPSERTFSVRATGPGTRAIEWAAHDLDSIFVQRRNLFDPRFLRMLLDRVRFNRQTAMLARDGSSALDTWTLGEFLEANHYSRSFRDWFLLPMAAAIWSCPATQVREFPLPTFVRLCATHRLLQAADPGHWYTVARGARRCVDRIVSSLDDVLAGTPAAGVVRVRSDGVAKVAVRSAVGTRLYDHVVLACHADQALALLEGADRAERDVLRSIAYRTRHAVLHTDVAVLPVDRRAWAACNCRCEIATSVSDEPAVSVHFLINKMRPLPFERPLMLSLDPTQRPDPSTILGEFDFAHPVFDGLAVNAQHRLARIQGRGNVWFCGAWTADGLHEGGSRSGFEVADAIAAHRSPAGREGRPEAQLAA